jgi:hypothetical protein
VPGAAKILTFSFQHKNLPVAWWGKTSGSSEGGEISGRFVFSPAKRVHFARREPWADLRYDVRV